MKAAIRIVASALSLSAAGLVGVAVHEGYTDKAVIPIKGDVPTKGFGETRGVKLGDTTTPVRALIQLNAGMGEYERAVQKCANVPMTQVEFDMWVNMTYNIGSDAFCKSTMAKELVRGNRIAACDGILMWKRAAGRDCSKPESKCMGLWKRRLETYKACTAEAAK